MTDRSARHAAVRRDPARSQPDPSTDHSWTTMRGDVDDPDR